MNKWLKEVTLALADALEKSEDGDIPLQNIYMLAPVLYSDKFKLNNEELLQEMIEVNDKQVSVDWSLDEKSKKQYKFHFISSYLYCFVVAGQYDEFKYDQIMEYICTEMDVFTNDYGIG